MSSPNVLTSQYFVKPACVGAVGAVASRMAFNPSSTITIKGMTIPLWLALGAGFFVGSIASEFVHQYLFPHLGPQNRTSDALASVTSVGTNYVTTAGLLTLNGVSDLSKIGPIKIGALAAAAEIGGDYLSSKFVSPMLLGVQTQQMY